jgi:hypothetical protein
LLFVGKRCQRAVANVNEHSQSNESIRADEDQENNQTERTSFGGGKRWRQSP